PPGLTIPKRFKEFAEEVKEVKDVDLWRIPPSRASLKELRFGLTTEPDLAICRFGLRRGFPTSQTERSDGRQQRQCLPTAARGRHRRRGRPGPARPGGRR